MASFPDSPPRPRWLNWAGIAAVWLVVWLVFRRVTGGAMLQWDDDINVQNNSHVHGLSWENIRWMFTDGQYMRRYLPLGWLRWAVDYQAYGPGPRSFHIGNLILHLIDAGLLFVVIRRFLRIWPVVSASESWAVTIAAIGALAWAIHPLRVETVSWISTGQYCQAVFFLLLSLLCYLALASAAAGAESWRRPAFWGSLVAFSCSLLSYPAALGYAAVLVVLDFLVLRRFPAAGEGRASARRWIWIEKIPFAFVTLAVMAATLATRYQARGIWQPPPTLAEFGLAPRIMQAFYVWAYYLWKPLWPAHLAPVYLALVHFRPGDWPFVASLLGVLAITGLLILGRSRWPGTLAAWLCHLALLVPMLGLSEHPHYTSDRYNYLASIPWSIALSVALFHLWTFSAWRRIAVPLAVVVLAFWGMASSAQVQVWRNSETLFRHVLVTIGPDPYRHDILTRLGRTLLAEGRLPEAEASFREAVEAQPADLEARGRLGLVLFQEGREAEAVAILGPGARLDPQDAVARNSLVKALVRAGWLTEAVQFCADAVRLNPHLPDAQSNLGIVLAMAGRKTEGLSHLAEAVRLDPDSPNAHFNFATALQNLGRSAEAREQFEAALRLQPAFPQARAALSQLPGP